MGLLSNPPLNSILAGHEAFPDATEVVEYGVRQPRQSQRRLTGTEVDDLVRAYEHGAPVRRLVAQLGINRTTVLAHLKRRGIPTRANRRKLTDKKVERAAVLYAAGHSLATIARVVGVDPSTVAKEFRRAGVSIDRANHA